VTGSPRTSATRSSGPCRSRAQSRESLERLVGARYWDSGRFERALALAASDGLAVQLDDGRYDVT